MSPAQPPYNDIEALIRATHHEFASAAFRIVRNQADAEDAIQSACFKVWQIWPKVSGFPTAARQRAYLYSTVRNEALQILRKRKRLKEFYGLGESLDQLITQHLAELARTRKDVGLALKVIDEMPASRRSVVKLQLEGNGYGEIAAMLNISVSTVRSHFSNARKHLRQVLPGDWKGE